MHSVNKELYLKCKFSYTKNSFEGHKIGSLPYLISSSKLQMVWHVIFPKSINFIWNGLCINSSKGFGIYLYHLILTPNCRNRIWIFETCFAFIMQVQKNIYLLPNQFDRKFWCSQSLQHFSSKIILHLKECNFFLVFW